MFSALLLVGIAFLAAGTYSTFLAPRSASNQLEIALKRGVALAIACLASSAVVLVFAHVSERSNPQLSMLSSFFVIAGSLVIFAVSVVRRAAKTR